MFDIKKYSEINNFLKKTSSSAKIVAISKNHPIQSVMDAINAGVYIFGENRVQEAQEKFQKLKLDNTKIELHLTGPLQSNKVKPAIQLFDVFHTLDREKVAREFSKHRELLVNKKIFLQVNTGKEKSKSGIFPEDTKDFLFFLRREMKLPIIGLMCIPPMNTDPEDYFVEMNKLKKDFGFDELSMGMSSDYLTAIKHLSTYVRIGSSIFGQRS